MIQYPSVPINGQATTTQISAFPDTRSIVIYNESQYFLQVTLVGSGTYGLAAYTADAFPVFSGFTGTINVMPTQYITVESGTPPASIMFVQAYGVNEQVSKLLANNQPTGYPLNLSRLQNIGNGSQVAGNASSLVNTGNPVNTSIISVTPSDAASPTWSADNEGNVTIKGNNAGTLTTLLQLIAGASPEVILAASGILTELLGNLQVNGTTKHVGNTSVQASLNSNIALAVETNADTQEGVVIFAHDAGQTGDLFVVENSSFTPMFAIEPNGKMYADTGAITTDGSGNITIGGSTTMTGDAFLKDKKLSTASSGDLVDWSANTSVFLKAISSSLPARLTMGVGTRQDWTIGSILSGSASGTSGTVTHNMNIPNTVIIVPTFGSGGGSATVGIDSITNTSFHWTIGAGTGINWLVLGK